MNILPNQLTQAIQSGRALLFTGAGFSLECKNFHKTPLLRASELANEIGKLGGFDARGDLKFAAGNYLKKEMNIIDLITLLSNTFTLNTTTKAHQVIAKLPWLRCYTTNYDNSIEIAGNEVGKHYVTIDVENNPHDYSRKNLVVHINGSIKSLSKETLNTSFKLSKASYFTDEGFISSPWHRTFEEDLDRCAAVIFIGYSLYDFDIEKLLHVRSKENLHAYFITAPDISDPELFHLEEYGTVLKIGLVNFSEKVEKLTVDDISKNLQSLTKIIEKRGKKTNLSDEDIHKLFTYGIIESDLLYHNILTQQNGYYVVPRTLEKDIENQNNKHTIITGDLGTGKTLFLQYLAYSFFKKGYTVYVHDDPYSDIISDLDIINEHLGQSIILIDDYAKNFDTFKSIVTNYAPEKIRIIATSRTSIHRKYSQQLESLDEPLSIDSLSLDDSEKLVEITNTLGAWKRKTTLPEAKKLDYIYEKLSTFPMYLIDIFESESIKNRIHSDMQPLLGDKDTKDIIFVICVLVLALGSASLSLIAEMTKNNKIRSSKLKETSFYEFFKVYNYDKIRISPIFAQHFLKSFFTPSEVANKFIEIATEFDKKDKKGDNEEIFKFVLKFSSIERVLSDKKKIQAFSDYYDQLKRNIKWLERDPHFWVQYGMAKIAVSDYERAQEYIDNAYTHAKTKGNNYNTNNIDTQQARLYLLKYLDSHDANTDFDNFKKANKIFKRIPEDKYKYRQLILYVDVIKEKFNELSDENKQYVREALKYISKRTSFAETSIIEIDRIEKTRDKVLETLSLLENE